MSGWNKWVKIPIDNLPVTGLNQLWVNVSCLEITTSSIIIVTLCILLYDRDSINTYVIWYTSAHKTRLVWYGRKIQIDDYLKT